MPIASISLTIVQHDDHRFYFTLFDSDGADLDPDDLSELTFIFALGVNSVAVLTKLKSLGEIVKSGANEVYFDLSSAETGAFTSSSFYCEMKGVAAVGGLKQTLAIGAASVRDTQIGDYP